MRRRLLESAAVLSWRNYFVCYNLASFHMFVSLGAGANTCCDVTVLDFLEAADSPPDD